MRFLAPLLGLIGSWACAQTPDLVPIVDVRLTTISSDGDSSLRWYDGMGRHSLVGIRLILEQGYRVVALQRFQRIVRDPDRETLEEAYIEDPGRWRAGRQILPFGSRNLIRDGGTAARVETRLVFDRVPIVAAVADNGAGLPRGFVARVGDRLGASVAVGNHFGIAGVSLCALRRPEESPGRGRGHRTLYGLDFSHRWGGFGVSAEFVAMREPETQSDPRRDVTDIALDFGKTGEPLRATVGWARDWRTTTETYRAEANLRIDQRITVGAFWRVPRSGRQDFGATMRIKL
jgi:hypothetical protein